MSDSSLKDDDKRERIQELAARPYQNELLEKAKRGNTIVYLGTGSGKTYIATMLIKDLRPALMSGRRAVFLVSSVPLVDQQSEHIRRTTGLSVGAYCGADGVDDWSPDRWREEIAGHQVLVLIHQVFLDLLTHSFFRISDASLIVMDECHHAQSNKDHSYTRIMKDWYHRTKREGGELPRILGLTACLMVKSVPVHKFHTEKEILEDIMDSRVETTEDLYDILKFVTSPDERISVFRDNLEDVTQKAIIDRCFKTQELLHDIKEAELARLYDEAPNIQMKAVAEQDLKNHFKILKNEILGSIVDGVSSLGLIAIKLTLENFKLMFRKIQDASVRAHYGIEANTEMASVMQACFGSLEHIVSQIRFIRGDLQSLEAVSSSKMMALVDILRNNQGCSTIIFVKTKFSAETINDILKEYSYSDPGLSGTSSDFAVSPGAKVNPRHPDPVIRQRNIELINEERRKLQTTLANFKSSQHPTNTLVSTNVVEEGLDVRSCNLVIKFDFPDNFRSYVQSKGRARAKPSQYILMVAEAERGKLEKKYYEYLNMEELSLRECHKRPFEGLPMGPDTDPVLEYVANPGDPESAIITGSQAVRLVHKYIQQIKVDRFTKLTCVYETHEVNDRERNMAGYQTRCHMPHRTPFPAPVMGKVQRSKKAAKQDCALAICEMLHYFQELDQRLKVKKRKYIHDEDEEEEGVKEDGYNPNNRKVGSKKRRQFYQKEYPPEMKFDPQSSIYFLHKIQFTLTRKNESYKYREFAPEPKGEQLGLLTSFPLPEFSLIPIHHPGGEYSAQVTSVQVAGVDVDCARNFNEFIMTTVLKVSDAMSPTTGDFLIVPLKDAQINDDLLKTFSDKAEAKIKKVSLGPSESLTFDSVIFPSYKTRKENYFVEEFVPESVLNIRSKMPNSGQTFAEYFKSNYGLQVRNMDQKLIRLSSADKRSYMLRPCEDSKKSKKDLYNTTFLVPELVEVEPVTRMLWKQCQMLPFVIHRMSSLIGSTRFLNSLGYERNEKLTVPRVKFSPQLDLFERLLGVSTKPSDNIVTSGDILNAVTLRAANDQFDMERLEILGDCFLKYYTGVFLFHKLSGESTINTEEGDLTTKRSRVVGNKNLCLIARNLGLARCLVSTQMEPHTTWLPPGLDRRSLERKIIEDLDSRFGDMIEDGDERKKTLSVGSVLNWVCDEDLGLVISDPDELLKRSTERFRNNESMGLKLKSFSLINDKSLADCIEALIGCFLLKTGPFGALQFMSKIGLDMSSSNTVDDLLARKISNKRLEMFDPPRHGFSEDDVGDTEMKRADLLYQKLGVSEIENIIGYNFREKSFLLQAFTHASYCDNRVTGSFERLEYLGDGVLDYLVTVYIYTQLGQDKDPGKITDIRSAVVCNNMFASVLVSHRLHHYILLQSPELQHMITSYVEDLAGAGESLKNNINLINEIEPPELKFVEVPKALGDVFESLMGAIYLDSGHNLKTVWKVFRRLFTDLDSVIANPPKNAKKELLEMFPTGVKITSQPPSPDRELVTGIVTVTKAGSDLTFRGLGHNKTSAQLAACKMALKMIKSKKSIPG